jgi:4-aminobutyrate aminotransferase-like enzyme
MKLTEQQFLDSLNAGQAEYFNARLISIRDQFQATYAESVASVSAAKDQQLIDMAAELQAEQIGHAEKRRLIESLKTQVQQLTASVAALTSELESKSVEKVET